MAIGTLIRQRRTERNLTQQQVAWEAGISKPYLSHIETGKAKNPPSDEVLRALQRVLGFTDGELCRLAHLARTPVDIRGERDSLVDQNAKLRRMVEQLLQAGPRDEQGEIDVDESLRELADENAQPAPEGRLVPIINDVAAGYPHHFTDLDYPVSVADEYIRCPGVRDEQAFAARIVGDSMEPDYSQGDIVIFSPNTVAESGDDCFVRFEDLGTTFKRAYQDDPQNIRLQPLNSRYPAQTVHREQVTGLWPAVYRIQKLR